MIRGYGNSRTRFPGVFGTFSDAAPGFVALFEVNSYALSLLLFVSNRCFSTIHISIWLRSFCRCKFLHHFAVVSLPCVLNDHWAKDKPGRWQNIVQRCHMTVALSNSHHSYILIRTLCMLTILHSDMMVTRLKMKDAFSCTRPQATWSVVS
jgi:hypothetical protein